MRYQICVSGSATGPSVRKAGPLARELGKAIAEANQSLITGATVGLPEQAVKGFNSVVSRQGVVIGFSPATSSQEHRMVFKLPTDFDFINYTGMAYVGRDIHLVRSSDALILVGGRMGSLHELTTALDSHKVCAVLLGSGGLADQVSNLVEKIDLPGAKEIIFDTDPHQLVKKVIAKLDQIS